MKIKEYIESGIIEAYVLGSASEPEIQELLDMKRRHPQIQEAIDALEYDLERLAQQMAITPPPGTFSKIEGRINELIQDTRETGVPSKHQEPPKERKDRENYIEVEGSSSHMKVHKIWRWLFVAVFILGKIFLGFAIYFYLENRQLKEQVTDLKNQLQIERIK